MRPRVAEGVERAFHSTTESRTVALAMAAAPGDELKIVLDTELKEPGQNQTASNVDEPSVAMNGDVVLYTGNWYAAISNDGGKTCEAYRARVVERPRVGRDAPCRRGLRQGDRSGEGQGLRLPML
jgi:hypothetical protein